MCGFAISSSDPEKVRRRDGQNVRGSASRKPHRQEHLRGWREQYARTRRRRPFARSRSAGACIGQSGAEADALWNPRRRRVLSLGRLVGRNRSVPSRFFSFEVRQAIVCHILTSPRRATHYSTQVFHRIQGTIAERGAMASGLQSADKMCVPKATIRKYRTRGSSMSPTKFVRIERRQSNGWEPHTGDG
jgi:hypothetical protein